MRGVLGWLVPVGLAVALASCGADDDFSPTVDTVAGTYSAATFTVTSPAGTINLLASGSTVAVTLAPDGTTAGHLFVPGGGENGEDVDADLTGTWTLNGSTVTFSQSADTFIRDVEFTATRDRLSSQGTFGDQTVHLVLIKTD